MAVLNGKDNIFCDARKVLLKTSFEILYLRKAFLVSVIEEEIFANVSYCK